MSTADPSRATLLKLPRSIWALGLVSLFMDLSSEMIHALLPVFLVTVLGASTITVGVIEGVGEATASITKVFSGWLSDRLGQRKVARRRSAMVWPPCPSHCSRWRRAPPGCWRRASPTGSARASAARRAMHWSPTLPRPRCAAPPMVCGNRSTRSGAFLGPLLGMGLMVLFADDFRTVFWFAIIPGLIAVAILVFAVREPAPVQAAGANAAPIRLAELRRLEMRYWAVVVIGAVLTLARFSEAFLILRAKDAGLALALVPLVLIVMNVVYAATAYPAGALSDQDRPTHSPVRGLRGADRDRPGAGLCAKSLDRDAGRRRCGACTWG